MTIPIEKGDVVLFDFDLTVDGKVVETTRQSVAKKVGILQVGRVYRPHFFVAGAKQLIPGVEKALLAADLAEGDAIAEFSVDVPPEEGYGLREPPQVIPMAKFRGREVKVGMQCDVDNRPGTVIRIGGGRVVVDCNHRFAGKTLHYVLEVRQVYKDPKSRASALVAHHMNEAPHGWSTGPDGVETLTVVTPTQSIQDPRWMGTRTALVWQIVGNFAPIPVRVVFHETYEPAPQPIKELPPGATPPPITP